MSRAAISMDRVEFNPEDNTLIVYERKDRPSSGMQANYTIMEFMALLAAHIPSPYESLVYYYGIYSSSHRGKERRENRCNQGIEIQETKGAGRASSIWARLIHRIFEVNPLLYRKCGGNMRIVAFITDYQTSKKILMYIGEETVRPPPLRAKIPTANITDTGKIPKSPAQPVCPKTGCSPLLPVEKPARWFKTGKYYPSPCLCLLKDPQKLQKFLDSLQLWGLLFKLKI